ncbi:hypothetical protein GGF31_005261, partial [Allomyces arbusculus]
RKTAHRRRLPHLHPHPRRTARSKRPSRAYACSAAIRPCGSSFLQVCTGRVWPCNACSSRSCRRAARVPQPMRRVWTGRLWTKRTTRRD